MSDVQCLYCASNTEDGHDVCVACDRGIRDDSRAMFGLAPFTDEEYAALRRTLLRRATRRVLVVNGGAL